MGARVETTEHIVMDETGTHVVQSVRRVPEGQRYDHRLLQSVRGTHNCLTCPTQTYHSDNRGTRNVYIRKIDLERFGHTAGYPASEVYRAGSPTSGQEHTEECRKRLEDVLTTDASTSTRVKATRVRHAERIIRNSKDPGVANPSRTQTRSIRRPGAPRNPTATQKCGLAVRRHPRRAKDLLKLMQNALRKRH